MINKKTNRLICSILGVVLTVGMMEIPALANESGQTTSVNSSADVKNYNVNKSNSIEKNGLNISIDKIVATKHKLRVTVLVESKNPIEDDKGNNVITNLTYGQDGFSSESVSSSNIDKNKLLVTIERDMGEELLQEKGDLRVDLVIPKYKINVGLDANVDFSEAFKNTIEKEVSGKIPEFNMTFKGLESNALGTTISYSQPESDFNSREENDSSNLPFSTIVLKVGDKMYRTQSSGGYMSRNNYDIEIGTYDAQAATYEKVKDQKNISIIPVLCSMTWSDIRKTYDDNGKKSYNENREAAKETSKNVNYKKYFEFSDGSKGEVYNIERDDSTLKVYCKGSSEIEGLLMASNMFAYYNLENGQLGYNDMYDYNKNSCFYKDSKDNLGYVVEFDNVDKDKIVDLDFESMIKQIDKFKIGSEIQVTN